VSRPHQPRAKKINFSACYDRRYQKDNFSGLYLKRWHLRIQFRKAEEDKGPSAAVLASFGIGPGKAFEHQALSPNAKQAMEQANEGREREGSPPYLAFRMTEANWVATRLLAWGTGAAT